MPDFLKELFTTYWSQSILLIGSLGYLFKRAFDLRSKKIELKYSLFEQNRIDLLMKFLTAYLELEQDYKLIPEGRFKIKEMSPVIYDSMYLKKNANLYTAYFYLKLFLDPMELARYSDLVSEMRIISNEIKSAYIKLEHQEESKVVNDLNEFIVKKIGENNENMKVIGKFFREYSNKSYSMKM